MTTTPRVDTFIVDGSDEWLPFDAGRVRPATKFTTAYGVMRRAIVTHELPDVQPLDESWLMETFSLSRTPLREALKRLAHEKFLSWPTHQAPVIRDITIDELARLFETRMLVEPQIARLAAQRSSTSDTARIEQLVNMLTEVSKTEDIYKSVEFDLAFHAMVSQATNNRFLRETSDTLNRQSLRMWFRSQRALGIQNVDKMHRRLAEAISVGDQDLAESLAVHHVERFFERQLELQRRNST